MSKCYPNCEQHSFKCHLIACEKSSLRFDLVDEEIDQLREFATSAENETDWNDTLMDEQPSSPTLLYVKVCHRWPKPSSRSTKKD